MENFGDLSDLLGNRILWVALAASLIAQALKLGVELIRNGKVSVRILFETGGMPSAHSALVAALAAEVGLQDGWGSSEFAIATLFALIVMYDAAGVRQAAGKQARILNQIIDEFFQGKHQFTEERLKELLGHTPVQVFVGLWVGIGVACVAELAYQHFGLSH
jgi:acid phosphatase family membrane protein YuiD